MPQIMKNGVIYSGSTNNSKEIYYNNTNSNLESTNVQDAIDEIDNKVSSINNIETIVVPCDYINSKKEFTVFKMGKICSIDFFALTGLQTSANTTIAVLPEEYCPLSEINMDVFPPKSSAGLRIMLNPKGEIIVYNYTESTGALNIRAHIVYLCK